MDTPTEKLEVDWRRPGAEQADTAEKFSSPHHRDGHIASIVSMNCDEWERGLAVFDLARSDTNDVLGKLVGTARAWA
jgi:hypothetical protein